MLLVMSTLHSSLRNFSTKALNFKVQKVNSLGAREYRGQALALHVASSGSISSTLYGAESCRSDPWAPQGVAPKQTYEG